MPDFTFNAIDRNGYAVEGSLSAEDLDAAVIQVQQMGYTPQRVTPAALAPEARVGLPVLPRVAPEPQAEATSPMEPDSNTPPASSLLHSSVPGRTLLNSQETTTERMGHIEPWQRGGPIPEPPAPTPAAPISLNGVAGPSYAIPMGAVAAHAPIRPEVPRGGREGGGAIPYGAGMRQEESLVERFKATMIYPIYAGVILKDLAEFYRQFATLISAGIPIQQALNSLEASTQNKKLKEITRAAQRQVLAGGRLSAALAAYPWVFPTMHVELIRAAEEGGMLESVLRQIADYVDHELEIRRLISRETLYTKIVLFVALMILGRSGAIGGGQLPIVQLVKGGSVMGFLNDTLFFGVELLLAIFAITALFRLVLFNIPGVREIYDTVKMRIPALGKLIRMFAIAKFSRTFAALYRSGMGMLYALEIAGDSTGNAVIRKAARRAAYDVQSGKLASDSLQKSGQFTPMAIDLMRTGETSGSLDMMMDKVADFYENEGKLKAHQVAMIFTTVIYLLVALLIAINIVAFYVGEANSTLHAADGG